MQCQTDMKLHLNFSFEHCKQRQNCQPKSSSQSLWHWPRPTWATRGTVTAYLERCIPACCQHRRHPASLSCCRPCRLFSHAQELPHWEHSPQSAHASKQVSHCLQINYTSLCSACLHTYKHIYIVTVMEYTQTCCRHTVLLLVNPRKATKVCTELIYAYPALQVVSHNEDRHMQWTHHWTTSWCCTHATHNICCCTHAAHMLCTDNGLELHHQAAAHVDARMLHTLSGLQVRWPHG